MDVKKVAMVITAMVLFSLATLPAPLAAMRFDVAKLLAAIEIPDGKSTGDSSWCDNCACTRARIPRCFCKDPSMCPKCVCYLSVPDLLKPLCEDLAPNFNSYCPSSLDEVIGKKSSSLIN